MPFGFGFNDQPFRPGDQAQRIKQGDLRDMQEAKCSACGHTWFAPVIGRCPKCRAEGAQVLQQVMIGAPKS